jgi:hypothetical protein
MSQCQHPVEVRSNDLATGNIFCGDCGDTVVEYNNQPRQLSGDDAAVVIGNKLAEEKLKGSVVVHAIQPTRPHEFVVSARLNTPEGISFRDFTVVRLVGNKLAVK